MNSEHTNSAVLQDSTRPLAERLEAAAELLRHSSEQADTLCVSFLDTAPPHTPIGQHYRELMVTEGACVDGLCVVLWERDPALRRAAAVALGVVGDPAVIGELAAVLRRQLSGSERRDVDLIIALIEALGGCWKPREGQASAVLLEALRDEDEEVRSAASNILRQLHEDAPIITPALIKMLREELFHLRFEALELLPELSDPATYGPAVQHVAHHDPDSLLRWIASHTLDHHRLAA